MAPDLASLALEIDGPRADNALRVAGDLDVRLRIPARWPDSRRANAAALAPAER